MEQDFPTDSRFSMDSASWGEDFKPWGKRKPLFRLTHSERATLVALLLSLLVAACALVL